MKGNYELAKVVCAEGPSAALCHYLWPNRIPQNFAISGGSRGGERYQPLLNVFSSAYGRMPIIMMHSGSGNQWMERTFFQAMGMVSQNVSDKYFNINPEHPEFEPFLGMTDMQVSKTLKVLARKLEYTLTPKFEKTLNAHLEILKYLKMPVSLSGFFYLCSFRDMEEFHANVFNLPCDEKILRRIWNDLGADDEDSNSQFELFRTVIQELAAEAIESGWNSNNVGKMNCIQAVKNGISMMISLNNMQSDILFTYLAEELKAAIGERECLLILDNIKIVDEDFLGLLERINGKCYCGLVSDNIVNMIGEDHFVEIMEKMQCLVLFKHNTEPVADSFSKLIGNYECTKIQTSQGTNQEYFGILPRGRHQEISYSTETRYRVMPQQIIDQSDGQAIVFNTVTNEIVFYN